MKNYMFKCKSRLLVVILCLIVLCGMLVPVLPVMAADSEMEKIERTYEFLCRDVVYEPNSLYTDFWTEYTFRGYDIDFVTYVLEDVDSDNEPIYYIYFYILSNDPFVFDYQSKYLKTNGGIGLGSGGYNLHSNEITGFDHVFYSASFSSSAKSLDGIQGYPNVRYGVKENFDIEDVYSEFVSNGGFDWEVDASLFDNFYLTGLSMEYEKLDYTVYWSGTTLGSDIYKVFNPKVHAFYIDNKTGNLVELSSAPIPSGRISFNILECFDFDRDDDDWNGKVYLQPSFEYMGEMYVGLYSVVDTKTNNLYTMSSDSSQTITWDDFFLSNVNLTKEPLIGFLGYYKISWLGTTRGADLVFVPDSDTLVVATIALEDSQGNIINQELGSTTIGKGYLRFDMDKLLDQDRQTAYYWDGLIYLMPCFTKEGDLYMGQFTVVDTLSGDIFQDTLDEDDGIVHRDPVSSGSSGNSSFGVSSMTDYVSTGFDFLSQLIAMMAGFPALVAAVFQFIPSIYIQAIGSMLIIIFIARVLGR